MPTTKKSVTKRPRDYVFPKEVDRLLKAAAKSEGRHAHRNYTMILLAFRHGLRLGELTDMRWKMVDFQRKVLRVSRTLNGINSVHPLSAVELQALRKLKKEYPGTPYLFVTDAGAKLGNRTASRIVAEAGQNAGIKFHVSPSMLRRGCGHALADAGHNMVSLQHYLGHRNIRHTLRYMKLPPNPFKNFWK